MIAEQHDIEAILLLVWAELDAVDEEAKDVSGFGVTHKLPAIKLVFALEPRFAERRERTSDGVAGNALGP